MQDSSGIISSQPGHIEALTAKREALKALIKEARKHPATGGNELNRLKRENLKLKDEIEQEIKSA